MDHACLQMELEMYTDVSCFVDDDDAATVCTSGPVAGTGAKDCCVGVCARDPGRDCGAGVASGDGEL